MLCTVKSDYEIKMLVISLFILFCGADAAIYRLNESDYALFPKLMHLESFEACQQDDHAIYCTADLALVSDEPSPLLNMIQEYSAHTIAHYNHTKLHYGICLTKTCAKFYEKESGDLKSTLEACLNESMAEKHQLKVKVINLYSCRNPGKPAREVDQLDVIVGYICAIILMVNVLGSLCYHFFNKRDANKAFRILMCFSLQCNWRKLRATSSEGQDSRVVRLKAFNGIRVLNTFLVIIAHCMLTAVILIDNPDFVEGIYSQTPYQIILNGILIMQTFLVMSSFLLVYLSLIDAEKRPASWNMLPKYILLRWLRLTPVYIVALGLTATWFSHISSGPLWNQFVETEMNDCRQHWWQHILYINTFVNNSECFVQSWYLATDTQLYLMAVIIYLSCRTARSRTIVLSLMFLAGMIIPALVVYFKDLDGVFIISPETMLSLFFRDPHFINIYSKSHTNIPGYILGMALGYLVYYWQKQGVNFKKYQSLPLRILIWSLVPLGFWCSYTGSIFYVEGPKLSPLVNVAFAAFMKPVFGLIICGILIGLIFRLEDTYRGVLEWRGWTVPSRLSYSAYLMHVAILRIYVTSQTNTSESGVLRTAGTISIILVLSFIAAFFLYLIIEAPFSNLVKEFLTKKVVAVKKELEVKQKETKKKSPVRRNKGFNF